MKRPISLSIIAWFLIVTAVFSALSGIFTLNNPEALAVLAKSPLPLPIQYGMMFVGLVITLASGIAILKGYNWGRFLYLGWGVLGLIIGALTSPMKMTLIPGLVFLIIISFLLFRPKATLFFTRKIAANDA